MLGCFVAFNYEPFLFLLNWKKAVKHVIHHALSYMYDCPFYDSCSFVFIYGQRVCSWTRICYLSMKLDHATQDSNYIFFEIIHSETIVSSVKRAFLLHYIPSFLSPRCCCALYMNIIITKKIGNYVECTLFTVEIKAFYLELKGFVKTVEDYLHQYLSRFSLKIFIAAYLELRFVGKQKKLLHIDEISTTCSLTIDFFFYHLRFQQLRLKAKQYLLAKV